MVPKESGFNQSETALPANARAQCDVLHARLPRRGMVKLYKGSIFVITEAQFAIQSQVILCNNQTVRNAYMWMQQ